MKTIYLDNNATTAVAPEVRDAILPYLNELYGNPSSMHTFGGQVADAVETAREQMASPIARKSPTYRTALGMICAMRLMPRKSSANWVGCHRRPLSRVFARPSSGICTMPSGSLM